MTRPCRKCGAAERNSFGKCRPCQRRCGLAFYHKQRASGWKPPPRGAGEQLVAHLRSRYGLEVQDYAALLFRQEGRCAICGDAPKHGEHRLDVDHCHATGRVRGLLCRACNTGIGKLRDDPALMRRAAEYVTTPA